MPDILNQYPALKPYVNSISIIDSESQDNTSNAFRFFADGRPGIMYIESAYDVYLNVDQCRLPDLFLYGQTVKPIEIKLQGSFRFIIFYLYPHVIRNLFRVDAHELTDSCINFAYLFSSEAKELEERIQETKDSNRKVELIAEFMLDLISKNNLLVEKDLDFATGTLFKTNGEKDLPSLQHTLNMTERTFQRKFQQHVGVSPKQFARIAKFNGLLMQLNSRKYQSLTDIAYEYGFADQSHFNRTFREFTGMTPKEYLLLPKND
jgi:AraC-like DNA-binding protein